jgi:hypothetical protein
MMADQWQSCATFFCSGRSICPYLYHGPCGVGEIHISLNGLQVPQDMGNALF